MKFVATIFFPTFILYSTFTSAAPLSLTKDLKSSAVAVKNWVKNDFQAQNCVATLGKDFYEPLNVYLSTGELRARYSKEQLTGLDAADPQNALVTLYEARQLMRDRFREMVIAYKFPTPSQFLKCSVEVRVAMRSIRSWEEQFALYWAKKNGKAVDALDPKDLARYNLGWPQWMVHPQYRETFKGLDSIQNGDLLLSRGDAFTSAVISRIGVVDNQFSHIAMVYVDDGSVMGKPGKKYVIESVLNAGLQIIPFEEYMTHTKARWGVFRLKNVTKFKTTPAVQIMADASKWLAIKAKKGNVCYNFSMDMNEANCMFCSQAITQAMDYACNYKTNKCEEFPAYRNEAMAPFPLSYTEFATDQNPLMKLLHITSKVTFSPADVEVDPRLDQVAEFRNLGYTELARTYDIIFTKMFEWMESGRYTFADSAAILAFTEVGDEIVKQLGRMPPNTPPEFTQASLLLFFLVEHTGPGPGWADLLARVENGRIEAGLKDMEKRGALSDARIQDVLKNKDRILRRVAGNVGFKTHIQRLEQAFEETTGQPISEYDISNAMENIRTIDCEGMRDGQEPLFHDLFAVKFAGSWKERCGIK